MKKEEMIKIIKNSERKAYNELERNENKYGKHGKLTRLSRRTWATLYELLIDLEIEKLDA